jgi:hypothetical protein
MPYATTHKGIYVEYIEQPDGSVDLVISPEFSGIFPPTKIGVVTVKRPEAEDQNAVD